MIFQESFPESMKELITMMWEAGKRKNVTYFMLLNIFPKIEDKHSDITRTSPSVIKLQGKFWGGRPLETDGNPHYSGGFRHSRWREDWEELEHLGEGGFGRVGMIVHYCKSVSQLME